MRSKDSNKITKSAESVRVTTQPLRRWHQKSHHDQKWIKGDSAAWDLTIQDPSGTWAISPHAIAEAEKNVYGSEKICIFQTCLALKRAFQPGTEYVFKAFSGGKGAVPGTVPLHTLGGTSQQEPCDTNVPSGLVPGTLLWTYFGHSWGKRYRTRVAPGTVPLRNPKGTSRKACLENPEKKTDEEQKHVKKTFTGLSRDFLGIMLIMCFCSPPYEMTPRLKKHIQTNFATHSVPGQPPHLFMFLCLSRKASAEIRGEFSRQIPGWIGGFFGGVFWPLSLENTGGKNPSKNPQQNSNQNLGALRPKSTLQGSGLECLFFPWCFRLSRRDLLRNLRPTVASSRIIHWVGADGWQAGGATTTEGQPPPASGPPKRIRLPEGPSKSDSLRIYPYPMVWPFPRPWSETMVSIPLRAQKTLEIKGFLGLERPFLDLVSQTPRPRGRGRPLFAEKDQPPTCWPRNHRPWTFWRPPSKPFLQQAIGRWGNKFGWLLLKFMARWMHRRLTGANQRTSLLAAA